MKKILALLSFLLLTQITFAFEITNKNINDLKFGKTNPTVKELQIFLNENGFYESEEGPGAPENETEYFGNTTVASVKIFQEYSELPITGKVDFKTGKAINAYIKEIEAEEAEYQSADYFNEDGENGGVYKEIEDISDRYKLNTELDTYTDDVTDAYLNKADPETQGNSYTNNAAQEKKWSLKDLLESSVKKPVPAEPEKQKTIFQRFFSIFD